MRPIALLAAVIAAPAAAAPSVDCAGAASKTETLVCADDRLAALDRELARLYALAANGPRLTGDRLVDLRASQRDFVRDRDDCSKASDPRACLRDAYALRIIELRQGYADARADDGAGSSLGPFPFLCEGQDAPLSVGFVTGQAALAVIVAKDAFWVLPEAPAASGARYAAGDDVFWTRRDEAMATLDGSERRCRLDGVN